jgi:hypothetical protein
MPSLASYSDLAIKDAAVLVLLVPGTGTVPRSTLYCEKKRGPWQLSKQKGSPKIRTPEIKLDECDDTLVEDVRHALRDEPNTGTHVLKGGMEVMPVRNHEQLLYARNVGTPVTFNTATILGDMV